MALAHCPGFPCPMNDGQLRRKARGRMRSAEALPQPAASAEPLPRASLAPHPTHAQDVFSSDPRLAASGAGHARSQSWTCAEAIRGNHCPYQPDATHPDHGQAAPPFCTGVEPVAWPVPGTTQQHRPRCCLLEPIRQRRNSCLTAWPVACRLNASSGEA